MKIINQIFKSEESFGFTLGQIQFLGKFEIQNLIDWGLFDVETRPNFIKEQLTLNKGSDYLIGLFKSNELTKHDFKFLPHDAIYYYLDGYSDSEEDWGDNKQTFKSLLEYFKNETLSIIDGCYLINKEWFSVESKKIRIREYSLYDFYFIIVWVDKNNDSLVHISEWFGD